MPTSNAKPSKQQGKSRLEKQYREIFQKDDRLSVMENKSLTQPSPYKVIKTYTTYGAYEDPI